MSFPIPKSIPITELTNNAAYVKYFRDEVDSRRKPNGKIHLFEAYNFVKKIGFGNISTSETTAGVLSIIQERFFGSSAFDQKHSTMRRTEIKLSSFGDGDTGTISHFFEDGSQIPVKMKIRMDGIDTLESNPSSKQDKQVQYTSLFLRQKYRLSKNEIPQVASLTRNRIIYSGKMAGLVASSFHQLAKRISLGPVYTRTARDAAMCSTLDMVDNNGRLIGRIYAGGPNQKEDLLAGFIQNALPQIMATAGTNLRNNFAHSLKTSEPLLNRWKKSGKDDLWKTFAADTIPDPKKIFSKEISLRLAKKWFAFCKLHPEANNDIQTMLVFIGVAPPYPKYRSNMTPIDIEAEAIALGKKGIGAFPPEKHGLNGDTIYGYMRPNADPKDPNASPVFKMFEREMSGGKELLPADCCTPENPNCP